MAISSIAKPLKLRLPCLPWRNVSKPDSATPPPDTTTPLEETTTSPAGDTHSVKEDELHQVFRHLDKNNDGRVTAKELKVYFESISDSMAIEKVDKVIGEFSSDGEDKDLVLLGFEEFVKLMELKGGEDDIKEVFKVYANGSGMITPEGLRQVLDGLGHVKSVQECEEMIQIFDLDGNGVLDFHEFNEMMTAKC